MRKYNSRIVFGAWFFAIILALIVFMAMVEIMFFPGKAHAERRIDGCLTRAESVKLDKKVFDILDRYGRRTGTATIKGDTITYQDRYGRAIRRK